jgi:2'-5' RNA ligase
MIGHKEGSSNNYYDRCSLVIPLAPGLQDEYGRAIKGMKRVNAWMNYGVKDRAHVSLINLGTQSDESLDKLVTEVQDFADILTDQHLTVAGYGLLNDTGVFPNYLAMRAFPTPPVRTFCNSVRSYIHGEVPFKRFPEPHMTMAVIEKKESMSRYVAKRAEFNQILSGIEWTFPINKLLLVGIRREGSNRGGVLEEIRVPSAPSRPIPRNLKHEQRPYVLAS